MAYKPISVFGPKTGLVQQRPGFLLPNDAFLQLQNAFVWREKIKRKQGFQLLGRLRRILATQPLGANTDGAGNFTGNIKTLLSLETFSDIDPGTVVITVGATVFTDPLGDGILVGGGGGTINYFTMVVSFAGAPIGTPIDIAFNYYPCLPAMGIRSRELNGINNEETIFFDTVYAYVQSGLGIQEFLDAATVPTIWTGSDSDFFWSTNYWVDNPLTTNRKIFWVTNGATVAGNPIRFTNGALTAGQGWFDFQPVINGATAQSLFQCRAILPFRGRLLCFNTWEGATVAGIAGATNYRQRIRWSQIGTPFDVAVGPVPVTNVVATAWQENVPGKGSFIDIPTAQDIVAVGFVRDNLVIYCERSTWQLRYTGRSIQPFVVEKVNTELGAESTFSAIQFDTTLVGIGDKGIVECDSFKSSLIDIKIPDLVFNFHNEQEGQKRVHGVRDFIQRLAYWTYPYQPQDIDTVIYPNRRLVYNYENDSWAIHIDSLTCLGTFQPQSSATWANTDTTWEESNFPWINRPSQLPAIVGGNQQGYIEYLDAQTINDESLKITNITGNTTTPTVITSPNHNLENNTVIKIKNIPTGTPFAASLNDNIFGIVVLTANTFQLWVYSPITEQFSTPQLDPPGVFVGAGEIAIRDGFSIVSKRFNFTDQGQNIQMGYIDALLNDTDDGAITMRVYADYNDNNPINTLPENIIPTTLRPDPFFNATVPTTRTFGQSAEKNWQRVYCPCQGNFLTLEWTLSNAQLAGVEQEQDVEIDGQLLWVRPAGTNLPLGI